MKLTGKRKIQIGVLLLPGILVFAIFTCYPIIKLFIMSFFEWNYGSILDQNLSDSKIILMYFQMNISELLS